VDGAIVWMFNSKPAFCCNNPECVEKLEIYELLRKKRLLELEKGDLIDKINKRDEERLYI